MSTNSAVDGGLVLAAVALLTASAVAHGDFEKGLAAFHEQDFATAAMEFTVDAHRGDPRAQVNLAWLYEHGLGVSADLDEALRWYRAAADSGDDRAQLNLAAMYFEGSGTGRDYERAAYWYRQAAVAGNGTARYNLAVMFEEGLGVEVDLVQAWAWLELAAATPDTVADEERRRVTQKLTVEEREAAQSLLALYRARYPNAGPAE